MALVDNEVKVFDNVTPPLDEGLLVTVQGTRVILPDWQAILLDGSVTVCCPEETVLVKEVAALGKEVTMPATRVATLLGTVPGAEGTVMESGVTVLVKLLDTDTEVITFETEVTLRDTGVNDITILDSWVNMLEVTALESYVAAKELKTELAPVKMVDSEDTEDREMTSAMPNSLFCSNGINRST